MHDKEDPFIPINNLEADMEAINELDSDDKTDELI